MFLIFVEADQLGFVCRVVKEVESEEQTLWNSIVVTRRREGVCAF